AQMGIVGIASFFWFMLTLGYIGWRIRRRVPEGFARAYVYGAIGGLAGTLVAAFLGDWVLPFVYNIGMAGFRASVLGWIFLAGLVVVEQVCSGAPRLADSRPTDSTHSQPRLHPTALAD